MPLRGHGALLDTVGVLSVGGISVSEVRVRFAPSPTGEPHIGWAHTAIFNWLFARHEGGKFVLRIEDTDEDRTVPHVEEIFRNSLVWLGMDYDEGLDRGGPFGPYRQSERGALYRPPAEQLLRDGRAYPCFCTPEELAEKREQQRAQKLPPRYDGTCRHLSAEERQRRIDAGEHYAVRLLVPTEGRTTFDDLVRGEVGVENRVLDDFVIMKSDGTPAYNFACVIDDSSMQITHVIRGEEHVSNTPKQMLIYRALGLTPPQFGHIPMILAPDRSKLSKRHGATSLREFEQDGYLPESIANYLMLLNWSPGEGDDEVIDLRSAAQRFRLEDVQKSAAIYDVKKLAWLNGIYMRRFPLEELAARSLPFFRTAGLVADDASPDAVVAACALGRERSQTLRELVDQSAYLFRDPQEYDETGVRKQFARPGCDERMRTLRDALAGLNVWNPQAIEEVLNATAERIGVARGELIHPTRLAITGRTFGPGLFELLAAVGQKRVLARLEAAARYCTERVN